MKNKPDWSKIDRTIIDLAGEWIGLGDIITVSPLVSAIKSASSNCKIYLIITGTRWNSIIYLMEGSPLTINVNKDFYRYRKLLPFSFLRFRRPWLKTVYFYDYMAPRHRASLLGYLLGAQFRFGYEQNGQNQKEIPRYNTHILPVNPSISVDLFYYSKEFYTVTGLKGDSIPRLNKASLLDKGRLLINALGIDHNKKIFVVHPGSSAKLKAKRWPMESFKRLIQKLNSKFEINTLIILGPDEKEMCNDWPVDQPTIFLENYSLDNIAAILSYCNFLISNDSGIMNLGFSLGVPGIGLFGPTDSMRHSGRYPNNILIQSRYNLNCPPCYGTERFMECAKVPSPCMEAITVGEVLEQIEKLLQKCAV